MIISTGAAVHRIGVLKSFATIARKEFPKSRAMRASVVYVPTCQKRAKFSYLCAKMSRGFERGKGNAYRLLQAAQLFERMAITSSPMARRGACRIRQYVFQDHTLQHTATNDQQCGVGISEVEDEYEAFNLAFIWLYILLHMIAYALFILIRAVRA